MFQDPKVIAKVHAQFMEALYQCGGTVDKAFSEIRVKVGAEWTPKCEKVRIPDRKGKNGSWKSINDHKSVIWKMKYFP